MKKIIFAIALVMTMGFGANAQYDGFFKWNDADNNDVYREITGGPDGGFALPTAHGGAGDYDTPLGSGLVVLTALGAGYAVYRKKYYSK